MVLFVVLIFAVVNAFIATVLYNLARNFGTSQIEKAKEEILMSKADVVYKKVVLWILLYCVSFVSTGVLLYKGCVKEPETVQIQQEAPQEKMVITDSKQFLSP